MRTLPGSEEERMIKSIKVMIIAVTVGIFCLSACGTSFEGTTVVRPDSPTAYDSDYGPNTVTVNEQDNEYVPVAIDSSGEQLFALRSELEAALSEAHKNGCSCGCPVTDCKCPEGKCMYTLTVRLFRRKETTHE